MVKLINNLKEIFNNVLRGGIVVTGNTCVVIGDFNNKVKEFIKPDGTYTTNWRELGSTAYLELPQNCNIRFAVLEWHSTVSSYITKTELAEAYNPIVFTTPKRETNISIKIEDSTEAIYDDGNLNKQSVKWIDVTNLISEDGEGYYTVQGIPTSPIVNNLNKLPNHDEAPGWSLIVVYENSNLPFRNLILYMGIQNQEYNIKNIDRTVSITGLRVPSIPKKIYLSVVASNGDPNMYSGLNIYNDISLINNSNLKYFIGNYQDASSDYYSGCILPYDNIFSGIIMNTNTESLNYGKIETRGTLGNLNNNAFNILNQQSFKRNRGKFDILSFDISNKVNPFQNQLILTAYLERTPSSSVKIISYGLQVDL